MACWNHTKPRSVKYCHLIDASHIYINWGGGGRGVKRVKLQKAIIIIINSCHTSWSIGQQQSSSIPVLQPMDGAPAVVHVLHFHVYSSSPGCLQSATLPLSLWGPVECNFGDGVGIHAQPVPKPAPLLPSDDGLHILLLAPC